MRHQLAFKQEKQPVRPARMAEIVGAGEEVARQAIDATEAFFARLGVATDFTCWGWMQGRGR